MIILDLPHKAPPQILCRNLILIMLVVVVTNKYGLWNFLRFSHPSLFISLGGECYVILICSHCSLRFLLRDIFLLQNFRNLDLLLIWKQHEDREVLVLFLHYISRAWYSVCSQWCKGRVAILFLELYILCLFLCHI